MKFSPLRRCVLIMLGFLTLSAGTLLAADEITLTNVTNSLRPYAKVHLWAGRTPEVRNETDASQRVKVLYAPGGSMRFSRLFDLPPRSVVRLPMAVRIEAVGDGGRGLRSRVGKLYQTNEIYSLWNADDGGLIKRQSMTPSQLLPGHAAVMAICSEVPVDNDATQYLFESEGPTFPDVLTVIPPVRELPDRWYGYSMVRAMLLGGVLPGTLRPSQREALGDWVRQGGVLVLTGNPAMPRVLREELPGLAGVEPLGVFETQRLSVESADGTRVGEVPLAGPFPMVELCPDGAEVLVRANGLPLLTRRAVGNGWVFTLAVPVGALDEPRLRGLWRPVIAALRTVPVVDAGQFSAPAEQVLRRIAGRPGPPSVVPLTVLAALAVLTVILWVIFMMRRRGELAWAVLVPAALLTAAGLYIYGASRVDRPRLAHVGLITVSDTGRAEVRDLFAYYSGPNGGEMAFSAGDPAGTIRGVGQVGGVPAVTDIRSGATMTLLRNVPINATDLFAVHASVAAPPGSVRLSFNADGLVGEGDNPLNEPLTDSIIYARGRSYRVGTLEPGRASVTAGAGSRLGDGEFTGSLVQDSLRNEFIRGLIAKPAIGRQIADRPVLIGYVASAGLRPLDDASVQHIGWSAVVLPVQLTAPAPNTRVRIPQGFVDVMFPRVGRGQTVYRTTSNDFIKMNRGGQLVVAAAPPAVVVPMDDVTARLTVSIRGTQNYRLTVYGLSGDPRRGTQTEIGKYDRPSGRVVLDVPDAERFVDAQGRYLFLLDVRQIAQPGSDEEKKLMEWNFTDIDVELEGITR